MQARYAELLAAYLDHDSVSDRLTAEAMIEAYQRANGLEPDGLLGPITMRRLDTPRFCAVPDRVAARGSVCRFDNTNWDGTKWIGEPRNLLLTWYWNDSLPGASVQDMQKLIGQAWKSWSDVAALEFRRTDNRNDANIFAEVGRIDGPSGTLAYSTLPCGPNEHMKQKYDSRDEWYLDFDYPRNGRISFPAVWLHEGGHALGLDHGGSGLLAPTYNPRVRTPQPGYEIDGMVLRYGPPVTSGRPPVESELPISIVLGSKDRPRVFEGTVREIV